MGSPRGGGGTNRQEKVGGGHVGGRCQGESRETKISIRLNFFFLRNVIITEIIIKNVIGSETLFDIYVK